MRETNSDEIILLSTSGQPVCKIVECYFANEYLDSYIKGELTEENRKSIKNHISQCPYCAYDYENIKKMYEKTQYKMQKNNKTQYKIVRAKICEFLITFLVGLLFVGSLFYFFFKIHSFSKIEKNPIKQEISEIDGITFDLK